jgi:ABC-type microcin C transport system duplicated ATPase subunit YejF
MRDLPIGPRVCHSPADLKSDRGLFYLFVSHDLSVVRQSKPCARVTGATPSPEINVTDSST